MKNKSLKKFCRLTKYIEQLDKDLYQIIDDLCISHYFKPDRQTNGVTFLYPGDKTYRQKIINAAYSNDPDIAVNMIKSLILPGYYHGPSDFGSEVVNLLRQSIAIEKADGKEVKLAKGLVLKKDDKFVPMSYRENMAVYVVSGKGEIGIDNPVASTTDKQKTGGACFSTSKKSDLHKLLANTHARELGSVNNIYVKKVTLHLKHLQNKGVNVSELMKYLGNDEFSDSYLLDMYCSKNCSSCFSIMYNCLKNHSNCSLSLGNSTGRVDTLTFDDYVKVKKEVLQNFSETANKDVKRNDTVLKNLHTPIDVRTKVCSIYGADKRRLGKDLFIVFCNISKDLWINDVYDKVDAFEQFAYIASKIYVKPEDLTSQGFDSAMDLTLYGNLLKSDVLLYVPQPDFRQPFHVNLQMVNSLPSPLEMKLYSLCYLVNNQNTTTKVGGGDVMEDKLLGGLGI